LSLRKKWYELICILFDSTASLLSQAVISFILVTIA
jgi:hypothetical protein